MRIQSLNHSTYQHQYHIVWGTKYRRKFLKEYVRSDFEASIYGTVRKEPTLHINALNMDEDHVHIQIEIPPSFSVAAVVQQLKIRSSKQLQKKHRFIREMYIGGNIWSVGYFSSTIGLNENLIKKYIEYQGKKEMPCQPRFEFS